MADRPLGDSRAKSRIRKKASKQGKEPAQKPNPNAGRAMLIVNPVAGSGEALELFEELEPVLFDLSLDHDHVFTRRRGHAKELARKAAAEGFGTIVVVGGDGTIFEAINGIMPLPRDRRPVLGIVPCGRDSDYCRTLEISQDWRIAASLLVSGRKKRVDVGRMEYVDLEGKAAEGYFANVAGLGFAGEVAERAGKIPLGLAKQAGGFGTYLISLILTYAGYKEKDVELYIDEKSFRVLAASVVVANCQFSGGKMRIAPEAQCDDGLLDVIVVGAGYGSPILEEPMDRPGPEHSRLERLRARASVAKNLPRFYMGKHIDDEAVRTWRGKKIRVLSDDKLVLQADGEVIGCGPFTAEIVPGAIEVIA